MILLAIETSCDETGAAIVSKDPNENYVRIKSNIVSSSLPLHAKTGGIIPNIAAREQLKLIIPAIKAAMKKAKCREEDIDAIAVTVGPGLVGSLLIGVETAKTLSYVWNKPIIPVNHLLGHIYANWLVPEKVSKDKKVSRVSNGEPKTPFDTSDTFDTFNAPSFPALALLVSGGHTDLVLLESHKKTKWIGGTLDDAAGEAFDKIGRLLNLPYPGGPSIEKASERGDPSRFTFPRPMIGSKDFNFSFSGLKAAVAREVLSIKHKVLSVQTKRDIAAASQKAIVEVLVRKTIKAAVKYHANSILLGGGVASNQKLHDELKLKIKLFVPPKSLCTDNAAMIGCYALFNHKPVPWNKITANPELYF